MDVTYTKFVLSQVISQSLTISYEVRLLFVSYVNRIDGRVSILILLIVLLVQNGLLPTVLLYSKVIFLFSQISISEIFQSRL